MNKEILKIKKDEISKTLKPLHNSLINAYTIINNFLSSKGIKWWPHAGTLLGFIRNNEITPWDDDMDMIMNYSDFMLIRDEFIQILKKNNFLFNEKIGNKLMGINIKLPKIKLLYKEGNIEVPFDHQGTIDLFFTGCYKLTSKNIKSRFSLFCWEAITNEENNLTEAGLGWTKGTVKKNWMKKTPLITPYINEIKHVDEKLRFYKYFHSFFLYRIKSLGRKYKYKTILFREQKKQYVLHPEIYKNIEYVPSTFRKEKYYDTFIWINPEYSEELRKTYWKKDSSSNDNWKIVTYWEPYHIPLKKVLKEKKIFEN